MMWYLDLVSGLAGFTFSFTAMHLKGRRKLANLCTHSSEPIVGYRVWGLKLIDRKPLPPSVYDPAGVCETGTTIGTLTSANHSWDWPFRKPLVKDKIENLGIHAIKNGANVPQLFASYNAKVAGEVYLWGVVDECTEGYLAEFAYPKELWMPEDTDPLLIMELEENYGVPVKLRADLVNNEWIVDRMPLGFPTTVTANQVMYQQANVAMAAQMQALANAQSDILKYGIHPLMLKPGQIVPLP